jgi:Flp pilus assembly protein TadG
MIGRSTKRRRKIACKANFIREDRGNIAPIFALLIVPLIGALGVATEVSSWYMTQGSMQNAADAAALAAAANVTSTGVVSKCATAGDPCYEAKAVAARYGYVDGQDNVIVTANANVACPSGTSNDCYEVAISKPFPIRLLAVLGFQGDTTIGSRHFQEVTAGAVAQTGGGDGSGFCMLGLSSSDANTVMIDNVAKLTDPKCGIYSNSSSSSAARCDNNCEVAGAVYAVGGVSTQPQSGLHGAVKTGAAATPDPYAGIDTTKPACKTNTPVTGGSITAGRYCGGLNLGNKGSVTLAAGTYWFENGFTLGNKAEIHADPTAGVTIIVVGDALVETKNNAIIDIRAPSTGTYAGIALMGLGTGGFTFRNGTTSTINGAIYFPNSKVTFENGSDFTSDCTQVVAKQILVSNVGAFHSNCSGSGVKAIAAATRYVKLVK